MICQQEELQTPPGIAVTLSVALATLACSTIQAVLHAVVDVNIERSARHHAVVGAF